jgi:hypothetical protein
MNQHVSIQFGVVQELFISVAKCSDVLLQSMFAVQLDFLGSVAGFGLACL